MSLSTTAYLYFFAVILLSFLAAKVHVSATRTDSRHHGAPPLHQAINSGALIRVSRSLQQRLPAAGSTENQTCECPPVFNIGALKCDPFSCEWTLENGYWFGLSPEFNDTLVVALCPTDYCYTNSTGSEVRQVCELFS